MSGGETGQQCLLSSVLCKGTSKWYKNLLSSDVWVVYCSSKEKKCDPLMSGSYPKRSVKSRQVDKSSSKLGG